MRCTGHVARAEEKRGAYMALGWKLDGKIPSERPRRRWEDDIGMDFEERCWEVTEWTDRVRGRGKWRVLVNARMDF
jgi:hypothetical protein